MPTDTARGLTDAAKFGLRGVAWSLGFFGVLRLPWTEAHAVLPLTEAQAAAAVVLFGTPVLPIEVTLACSGADALALCLGAILAYPLTWRARLAGAGGGAALILGLNTLRIGSLGRVAASPAWFNTLHVYLWPAVLTLAIAGYVFGWMRLADRRQTRNEAAVGGGSFPSSRPQPTRRFVVLTAILFVLFTVASPFFLESTAVLALAGFVARTAAVVLGAIGVSAHAAANVLWTPRGGFAVTQECISTPLVPVYLAAICAYSTTWRRLIVGVLATLPLFTALGILRLLVVALPDAVVASPLFVVHAFYQVLLGAVIVFVAALWRHGGGRRTTARAVLGMLLGIAFVHLLGGPYTGLVERATDGLARAGAFGVAAGPPLDDPQGAIALLPAFQVGLLVALWVAACVPLGWRRLITGVVGLALMQMATLLALHALASHARLVPHVRDVRAWAVVGPLLVVVALVHAGQRRRTLPTSVRLAT